MSTEAAPDTYLCPPCRRTYTQEEVGSRRTCPKCRSPLRSTAQMEIYRLATEAKLRENKNMSALFMIAAAAGIILGQFIVAWLLGDYAESGITILLCNGAGAALICGIVWQRTGVRAWAVTGSVLLHLTAIAFFLASYIMLGAMIMETGRRIPKILLYTLLLPLAGAIVAAWRYHNYRAIQRASPTTHIPSRSTPQASREPASASTPLRPPALGIKKRPGAQEE